MNEPVILFRRSPDINDELPFAQKYWKVVHQRTECRDCLVVGRYSVLPFYSELERDLKFHNCKLVNSFFDHEWISEFGYYEDLKEYTFPTWFELERVPDQGPFVLKGKTNSRKYRWRTDMFAPDKKAAVEIYCRLMDDYMIGTQGVIIRQYVPLKKLGQDPISGVPWSNEWRFFYYKGQLVSYGYYWASAEGEVCARAQMTAEGLEFAAKVAAVAAEHVDFYVLDVAEKEEGGWVLVEINDGQQSGLSNNDADVFYRRLRELIGG